MPNPFRIPQGTPSPEEVQDVTAGRSPTGIGGLTLGGVADFAKRAGGAGMSGAQAALQGLRDPNPSGGLMSQGLGMLGSLGRRLPAAYAAGQGNTAMAAQMQNQVAAQEQAAVAQAQQLQMAEAMAGLDPTDPKDLGKIAQTALQHGDVGTAMQLMDWIITGDAEAAKLAQKKLKESLEPPKTRTITEGRETVNQQWDPATQSWVEVGRGPKSSGVTVNTGAAGAEDAFYQTVLADTGGDVHLAFEATKGRAYKDPVTDIWVRGSTADAGKAVEVQGFIESMGGFFDHIEKLEGTGISTSLVGEGIEAGKAFIGEGTPEYRRFQQARQELLTQYVKARSGAQVSDKEIGRYEAMFPKFRDMFENGRLKPGAAAMLQGMIDTIEGSTVSRLPYARRAEGRAIFNERLGGRSFGVQGDSTADDLYQQWKDEGTKRSKPTPEQINADIEERLAAAGLEGEDPNNPSEAALEVVRQYNLEQR